MTFPYYIHLMGLTIHPHVLMEGLAYATGFALHLYIRRRRRELDTSVALGASMWLMVGALWGALVGARILALLESPQDFGGLAAEPGLIPFAGGKSIVGGLLGGWLGVEIAKKFTGTRSSTGDAWVFPLIVSTAIGRVGCFLTGLSDHTYGNATGLPWGVDFGDHILRHPTQLYEIVFLLLLAGPLVALDRRPHAPGLIFRTFILAYMTFRFSIEFIKPTYKPYLGVSAIQLACLAAIIYCAAHITAMMRRRLVAQIAA